MYHIPVMSESPGVTAASKKPMQGKDTISFVSGHEDERERRVPRKNRLTMAPMKFLHEIMVRLQSADDTR